MPSLARRRQRRSPAMASGQPVAFGLDTVKPSIDSARPATLRGSER